MFKQYFMVHRMNIIKMNYYSGNGTEVEASVSIEYLIEKI